MNKVVIIGGGPAGMMAGIAAAETGSTVTLLEKNERLGKKLYITGKGRCNLTNDCDTLDFFENVYKNPKFLYSAVYGFDKDMVKYFFEENGVPLKVERGNRVFPQSDKANDIITALEKKLKNLDVNIKLNTEVAKIDANAKCVYDKRKNSFRF